tara:strand:- start:1524 stop:1799 length:276 start_codon:yes stop_codon:yes gene_type:complete
MIENFAEACHYVSSRKDLQTDDDEKLMIYALFKIATIGKPLEKNNSMFNLTEQLKYSAWTQFYENYKDKEQCKKLYVDLINKLIKKYKLDY